MLALHRRISYCYFVIKYRIYLWKISQKRLQFLRIRGAWRNRIKQNFETKNAISVETSISSAGRGSSNDYIRRIRVYDAICAHKCQENFERYAGMKGQKPSAGWARKKGRERGGRWNSPIVFHLVERNILYNICNGPRSKISPPMETELVLRPLGIIHERLHSFSKAF